LPNSTLIVSPSVTVAFTEMSCSEIGEAPYFCELG
jgi:hypothetical protein